MQYLIQQGVFLKKICGENVLIAVGEAKCKCPPIRQLNSTGAYFWEKLEKGMDFEEIIADALEDFDSSEEQIRVGLTNFLNNLEEKSYLKITEK